MLPRIAFALLFVLAVATLVVARLPASFMDRVLDHATSGRLRLTATHGSLWAGSGLLALADGRRLHAMRTLEWRMRLLPGALAAAVDVAEQGRPQLRLRLAPSGVLVERLDLDVPLELVTAAIPHPAARAGWRGRLVLGSEAFGCNWSGACEGRLIVRWLNTGLDVVPQRSLGSHEIRFQALGKVADIAVQTLEGDIRAQGTGRVAASGEFHFNGILEGDPDLVDRLPNIMSPQARRTEVPGRVTLTLP